MKYKRIGEIVVLAILACAGLISAGTARAESIFTYTSGKLLLTGGVSQIEGAAGGGLTPWAVIGGYGAQNQTGGNAFYTNVDTQDYRVTSYGALVGIHDRVEISYARQDFDLQKIGGALGLGDGYTISQDTLGVKVKIAGNAVLEQDRWLPQIAVGAQFKSNKNGALVKALGARDDSGADYYIIATKLFLAQSLLVNGTIRATRANQFGILGYGGIDDDYHAEFEGSIAYLLNRHLAIGAEVRSKPDNLGVAKEGAAVDAFMAYAPCKRISFTLAYADLGHIVTRRQSGLYLSLQAGF
ncbi:DUF3034 family protein [Asticcacaulis taihuensis]|uniref:DUF3034 family protein n=1 Tax=Asticcacaulis taihuensis TaxID=260084 RepID=UPI003F7B4B04